MRKFFFAVYLAIINWNDISNRTGIYVFSSINVSPKRTNVLMLWPDQRWVHNCSSSLVVSLCAEEKLDNCNRWALIREVPFDSDLSLCITTFNVCLEFNLMAAHEYTVGQIWLVSISECFILGTIWKHFLHSEALIEGKNISCLL